MVFPYVDKKLSIKLTSEILVALLFDFLCQIEVLKQTFKTY